MSQLLLQTIDQIGREKNIDPAIIVDAIEEAMAVASKKFYRTRECLDASLNSDSGDVELNAVKVVVDRVEDPDFEMQLEAARELDEHAEQGGIVRIPMPTDQLGRIAAQAAKQVIYQKVRDAERENIYNEFRERSGELVTGIVKRFERGDMIVDLGRTEAILPRREQSRAEHYNIGDRIRVVIVEVMRASRGPQVVVSRAAPELLLRLFEMEVPEIYDSTVIIKRAVREGGDRAKVAVQSVEADVDPVGACVGMRGSRVQAIIRELRGEKIDIVEWSSDPIQFAINSLKPARVSRVGEIPQEDGDESGRHLEVIVDEDQLSLAIGKKGQNVRLAGKLLGCKIDVKGAEQKKLEVEYALALMTRPDLPVESLKGVGPKAAQALADAGFGSMPAIASAEIEKLTAVPGFGAKMAERVLAAAKEALDTQPLPRPEPPRAPRKSLGLESGGEDVAVDEPQRPAGDPVIEPQPELA